MVVGVAFNIEHIDPICTESIDLAPISSSLLSINPSHLHALQESLGDIRGYTSSFDPHCAYLEDVPRKIMWSTFFDHTFDFFKAFDKFKRALTIFVMILLVFSYSHHFEMHAMEYDKLL